MYSLNPRASLSMHAIGSELRPLAVIEDFAQDPPALLAYAESGEPFRAIADDFYPGIRKSAPGEYAEDFSNRYGETLRKHFGLAGNSPPKVIFCALSITTTSPRDLRPIQRVPHFDTSASNQLAIVHYLCGPEHGGTSFYRHRSTGFETITQDRLQHYAKTLKHEVMTKYPPQEKYMDGDDPLFERIAAYDARFNRALIYPSNVLHSGNIRRLSSLGTAPGATRLTINSFVRFA
jgi:hypothetical protein